MDDKRVTTSAMKGGAHDGCSAWHGLVNTLGEYDMSMHAPLVSSMMATWEPGRAATASRTARTDLACTSWSPWLKFRRATHMPASIISISFSTVQHAGPIVQMICILGREGTSQVIAPINGLK